MWTKQWKPVLAVLCKDGSEVEPKWLLGAHWDLFGEAVAASGMLQEPGQKDTDMHCHELKEFLCDDSWQELGPWLEFCSPWRITPTGAIGEALDAQGASVMGIGLGNNTGGRARCARIALAMAVVQRDQFVPSEKWSMLERQCFMEYLQPDAVDDHDVRTDELPCDATVDVPALALCDTPPVVPPPPMVPPPARLVQMNQESEQGLCHESDESDEGEPVDAAEDELRESWSSRRPGIAPLLRPKAAATRTPSTKPADSAPKPTPSTKPADSAPKPTPSTKPPSKPATSLPPWRRTKNEGDETEEEDEDDAQLVDWADRHSVAAPVLATVRDHDGLSHGDLATVRDRFLFVTRSLKSF